MTFKARHLKVKVNTNKVVISRNTSRNISLKKKSVIGNMYNNALENIHLELLESI